MSINNSTASLPTDAQRAKADAAWATAREASCTVEGCDGEMHDANAPADSWAHSLTDSEFDNGTVKLGLWTTDTKTFTADLNIEGETDAMTAAQLRAEADLYEAYPAFLRAAADKLDALNK